MTPLPFFGSCRREPSFTPKSGSSINPIRSLQSSRNRHLHEGAAMDAMTILEQTPLPFAKLLGIRFVDASPERVRAEMVVRDELCTNPAVLHGGALMAFADTLGACATAINLPSGSGTTTPESKTNFIAPAPTGSKVLGARVAR